MGAAVQTKIRGPEAYALARQALDDMEKARVWPTPLNFELWLHHLGDPQGALARELSRIIASGDTITEEVSETLAAEYLPRMRLSEDIYDAGAVLTRELASVTQAITDARQAQSAYGEHLSDASRSLSASINADDLGAMVATLQNATLKVAEDNSALETRLAASTREIQVLREHLDQVRRDAMTDALTNLANRKAFDEELERLCEAADRERSPLTLAVVDIDHFKAFNDSWGHQTGDQVLRYVASVLARIGRSPRVAARYGGEEFAMIFPSESAPIVFSALESARTEIASRSLRRRSTNEELGSVTVSAGLAQRQPQEAPVSLFERADAALYHSKRSGRNRITIAESLEEAA